MRKTLRYIKNIIFVLVVTVLSAYIIGMQFFPEAVTNLTGYKTYVILTDSMEPVIPVGSLVVDKSIKDGEEPVPDTIVSFRVDRFGKEVVFTHYYRKKELDETGKMRYFTQAENTDRYDDYTTYREDILGTYVFHLPYVGKFVLFLQSPFALLELGIILIIMVIYNILASKFEQEEKEKLALEAAAESSDGESEGMLEITLTEENTDGAQIAAGAGNLPEAEKTPKDRMADEVTVPDRVAEELIIDDDTEPEETVLHSVSGVPEADITTHTDSDGSTDHNTGTEGEEAVCADDAPCKEELPDKLVFSYSTAAPGDGQAQKQAENPFFSLEIFKDGTVWYKTYGCGREEMPSHIFYIEQRTIKKIRRIIRDNAAQIKKIPLQLENGTADGYVSKFDFMGHKTSGCNIRAYKIKKEKKQNPYYYNKYRRNMQYENEVMYVFKQITEVLKEEGIRLGLHSVRFEKAMRREKISS